MTPWDLSPPPPSELGDREVDFEGEHLSGRRIALLVCGGIAAMKTPLLARKLRRQGAEVTAFVTREALRYVTADALAWSTARPVVDRLSAEAEHLSDSAPFDAYLLPQATYNTINKLAHGIADGPLTATLASALGRLERGETRILVAPAMHGTMHTSILTESLAKLQRLGVRIVPPRRAHGKHNMPDDALLVAEVCRAVSCSPLTGRRILVTGGPTPVPLDAVRRITNRFRGRLGLRVAEELHLRGADAFLILGGGNLEVPAHLPHAVAATFDEYRRRVHDELAEHPYEAGIFSAGVADYRPAEVAAGKIASGGELRIDLVPTPKVIAEVRERHPELHMVTFKYEEDVSRDELLAIARRRLETYEAVIANRGDGVPAAGPQVAWLVTRDAEPRRLTGKLEIARTLADHLEATLGR